MSAAHSGGRCMHCRKPVGPLRTKDETPFAAVYNDADARLIAAAPDLLEALRLLLARTAKSNIDPFARQFAADAIAKATGGSHA